MAQLTDEIKTAIVVQLAMFCSPSQVVKHLRDEWEVEVTRQQVHKYNPLGSNGHKVGKKWKALFEATRAGFLKDVSAIPIANRAVRMHKLDRYTRAAEDRGNYALAAQHVKQAAEEMGGAYTNQRQIMGKDGRPMEFRDVSQLTDEQLDAQLKALLGDDDDDAAAGN